MARAPRPRLPREWRRFADRYGADRAYWYVPKGLAVTPESLKSRLQVLREFEGNTKPWRELQAKYVRRLNEEKISLAAAKWPEGGAPLARMLKKVFGILGLAWVDLNERVEITPAGEKFLSSKDPEGVLSDQLSRFQFWNPSVRSRVHREIRLHPIPLLGEVLRNIDGQRISATEYTLFISRAKAFTDVDQILEHIEAFRDLDAEMQRLVVDTCHAYKLGGRRRSSIYNTIKLNRSYALKMFALSRLIKKNWRQGRLGA